MRGLRCRPWRATARPRPPPRHALFSLASFLPILNRIDYIDENEGENVPGKIKIAAQAFVPEQHYGGYGFFLPVRPTR